MSSNSAPVITIDGPSGSGKGTIAMMLSKRLGWHYLDSGALYRLTGLLAARNGVALDDDEELARIAASMKVDFHDGEVLLDGESVSDELRTERTGDRASRVAVFPLVRQALLEWQRQCARAPGLVADGRDMGTVVFPHAGCKFFLTASAAARAERRFNQLRLKDFDVTIRELFEEIAERDRRDAERKISPLRPATDAISIDTTEMSKRVVMDTIVRHIQSIGIDVPGNQ